MRIIIQPRIIRVIQPEIVRYECDRCGATCGTKANKKETWYGKDRTAHYCKATCSPSDHPRYDIGHVLSCELCYRNADPSGPRITGAVLAALAGQEKRP